MQQCLNWTVQFKLCCIMTHQHAVAIVTVADMESHAHECSARRSYEQLSSPPFPQIDIIGAVVIVWRVRGKTIRSALCNIVCNNCAQCDAHTYEQTNSCLDWVFLTGPISLCLDSFLHVLCVLLYTVCMCRFVTR